MYYAFVSGLPDLAFEPEKKWTEPDKFLHRLSAVLQEDELQWATLLWFKKYHAGIAYYLSGHGSIEKMPDGFSEEMFNSENDSFGLLPNHIKRLVYWKESTEDVLDEVQISNKIQHFYFEDLANTENRFLNKWADFELNLLNYLSAQHINSPEEKQAVIIPGNDYAELLSDFTDNSRIIKSEFPETEEIDKAIQNRNFLEQEQAFTKLRWQAIDSINRFEYFSVDIVLGYFQKLLMLERWSKVFQKEMIEPDDLAEKWIQSYYE